jgi:8-oxo-dGTP diphosphatase
MFVQQEDQLLLIHKKRGLGAGKVNAPGGKLEDGEDYKAAAIRECQEEVGVTPLLPKKVGELYFRFADGYNLYGEVFWSFEFRGTPVETEEALPFWCPISDIPYEKMWRDDHIWLPLVLEGYGIKGWFDFDGDTMTSGRVEFAQR